MDTSARSSHSNSFLPQEIFHLVGSPDAPIILDVRREAPFAASTRMLAASIRCAPENVAAFATSRAPGRIIVYCVYGHNVSADAVSTLRAAGWDAIALSGGIECGQAGVDSLADIQRWQANPPLRISKRADLGVTGEKASRWITRSSPKIDRIACPWLVRRFIDPRAEFFYVDSSEVFSEAERLNAVAYDMPGAPITHDGPLCSFDTLLRAFGLDTVPALAKLAGIVRGADTDDLALAPQAAGLLAISFGLSTLHHTNDHAMLGAAIPVYDALYAWCKREVAGQAGTHQRNPAVIGAKA